MKNEQHKHAVAQVRKYLGERIETASQRRDIVRSWQTAKGRKAWIELYALWWLNQHPDSGLTASGAKAAAKAFADPLMKAVAAVPSRTFPPARLGRGLAHIAEPIGDVMGKLKRGQGLEGLFPKAKKKAKKKTAKRASDLVVLKSRAKKRIKRRAKR